MTTTQSLSSLVHVHAELDRVACQLDREHPEVGQERIEELVKSAEAQFAGAKITQFIPVLVRNIVLEELHRSAG